MQPVYLTLFHSVKFNMQCIIITSRKYACISYCQKQATLGDSEIMSKKDAQSVHKYPVVQKNPKQTKKIRTGNTH